MRCHGLSRPNRAELFCGGVADCENKVELGSAGFSELVPVLASQTIYGQLRKFDLMKGFRMHSALWVAPRTIGGQYRRSFFVHYGFGHDGTSRIARTQEQDVVASLHWSPRRSTATATTTAVLSQK